MDLNIYHHSSYCKDANDHHQTLEPGELLEHCWFFGNLLDTRTRKMSRSLSDPSTSSNFNLPGKSYEETFESIEKLSGEFVGLKIVKAPSLPPRMERKDRNSMKTSKESMSDPLRSKKPLSSNLLRAPSLPTSMGSEEFDHDEEIEFSMGKLIRQASLNTRSTNTLSPRTIAPKRVTPSPTTSKLRPKKKPEPQGTKLDLSQEIRPQSVANTLRSQKSLNSIESQGFKDLGFDLEKELSPKLTRTMSSFHEKQRIEENEEDNRMYDSETWRMKSSAAPPVPNWGGKKSTEDVKAQIKFWARAVASNVRQEC